ncbi:unnamed protein product, partial [Pylaiella littoralis]
DGRRKRRTSGQATVGTDAPEAIFDSTKGDGAEYPPGFRRGRAGIDGAKLPVYMFLQQGIREEGAVELLTKDIHCRVAQWWADNGDEDRNGVFTGNATR